MNTDLSVAPELAQLAASPVTPPAGHASASPVTQGRLAASLARLAASPRRWWDLIRFDPDGPVRIPVPGADGAWLLVLPPGATADCDCRYATLLAGDASERSKALRPGRVRVHGTLGEHGSSAHRIHGAGHGYSVTLHGTDATARSGEKREFYPERTVAALEAKAIHPR